MTKKEELEAEIDATVSELPQTIPPEKAQIFVDRGALNKDCAVFGIEFVDNEETGIKERKAVVHCTACGKSFVTDYKKEYSSCMYFGERFAIRIPGSDSWCMSWTDMHCPICSQTVEATHSAGWCGSKRTIVSQEVFSIENVRNHFCILSWMLRKQTDKSGVVSYVFERKEGVLLIGNRFVRVTSEYRVMGGGYSHLTKWERRKRFDDMLSDMYVKAILPFDMQEVYKTEAAHSAIDKYIEANLFNSYPIELSAYVRLWTKHKNVENLVVQGLGKIVSDILRKLTNSTTYGRKMSIRWDEVDQYINYKKSRPHLMLDIEKEEISEARRWNLQQLQIFKYVRDSRGIKLDTDTLVNISKNDIRYSSFREFFDNVHYGFRPSVVKTLNYIFTERKNEHTVRSIISLQYLRDYWNSLHEIYGAMPSELLYPKGLVKSHDEMNAKVIEKADRELDENIRKYSEENAHLAFCDEELGLQIFPAPSHNSLITEGKMLCHCVARYAKDVASGKTLILFIRKTSEPDKPFYTLEYKYGSVVQNRGHRNCSRTAEVKAFEEKWLKFIKRKERKNGKCNSKQSEQHAVA